MDFPPFPGFRPEAFDFLRALAAHNDREWFKPRKEVYEDEVLWPFRCLVADVTREARAQGIPLAGDPQRAIFRIYRDTRFSKDKDRKSVVQGKSLGLGVGRTNTIKNYSYTT